MHPLVCSRVVTTITIILHGVLPVVEMNLILCPLICILAQIFIKEVLQLEVAIS